MSDRTGSRPEIGAALSLTDFPDRLSPVFVRDLRRALRTPFLVASFVVLQALAFLAVIVESGISALFTGGPVSFAVALPVVTSIMFGFALPLAHFNSLQSEMGPGRNAELLVTARLSLRQIVGGRILVASSVSAVLLVSLLPYFLIRYFLGGTELPGLFHSMIGLFLTNTVTNAIVIGLSAFSNVVGRVVLFVWLISTYQSFHAPYHVLASAMPGFASPIIDSVGIVLVAALFTKIGWQLGMSKLRRLEDPHEHAGSVLILLTVCLFFPFIHFVALAMGGATAGILSVGLMFVMMRGLAPGLTRKKELKPAAPAPPFPNP